MELWVVPMTTVLILGYSSNIVCGVHHNVLAKVRVGCLGKDLYSTASLQLQQCIKDGKGSTTC